MVFDACDAIVVFCGMIAAVVDVLGAIDVVVVDAAEFP